MNNNKSMFFITCPSCAKNISILKVREEFKCGHCGSAISCPNSLETTLKSLGLYFVLTFVFYFLTFNFWTVTLDIAIFFGIMLPCLKRLECTIPTDSGHNANHKL
jgi:predicted RNA-binding Zn-ribbon protein involved in translation (DUF1610 family)